ncbi:MAG: nitric oxide synthase, partial [Hyphomicrobiales bacterium]
SRYDSVYGNTAAVAKAIGATLEERASVRLVSPSQADALPLAGFDLLIVGSPTRGFRPTPAIGEFVAGLVLPAGTTIRAAAFDTRLDLEQIHPAPLRWVVNAGGYAAQRIAQGLRDRGFEVVGAEGDFVVTGTEGPLRDGELERAAAWARSLA